MKKNNKIKYYILLIFVFFAFVWFLKNDEKGDEIIVDASQEIVEEEVRAYSRISFFHANPVRASLSVPEDWEGEYRMKESGNNVNFYYIGDPGRENLLFRVIVLNEKDFNDKEKYFRVAEKDDYIFVYELSTESASAISDKGEYNRMTQDIPDVISSFKVF